MDSVDDFVELYQQFIIASYADAKKAEAERLSHEVLDMGSEIADYLERHGMPDARSSMESAVEDILSGRSNMIESGGNTLGNLAGIYKAMQPK